MVTMRLMNRFHPHHMRVIFLMLRVLFRFSPPADKALRVDVAVTCCSLHGCPRDLRCFVIK